MTLTGSKNFCPSKRHHNAQPRLCSPCTHSWHTAIYTTDDISAPFHASRNKGGYANAYLTYIIDNYYNLPSTLVFIHTSAPDTEVASSIARLNITYVQSEGYANLRCNPEPGCMPRDTGKPLGGTAAAESLLLEYGTWFSLFGPVTKVPKMVAAPCCAQFAVSRDAVVKRPRVGFWQLRLRTLSRVGWPTPAGR
ncbi:hypothetical protein EJ03DRAFT_324225 [Teratosphaeria nubilosa]|uniref:Uncharacterized protein n=1 Tax=Teratosphaeria nubilosa TaxID=161662 RepID=A0A6G1LKU2_9PEZI|nr:hypothetical protein EJ03DRAFT_324225 [Teratosphaeria nubilosa]